ncbi:MAG: hypothetical protein JW944_13615 [Deltaproteobacteria bacterium]|nr:hypothetical protein [Deltaproteobacteria bacterium]
MEDRYIERIEDDDEINLLSLLVVILKRKYLIAGLTFACALITAIISLIMTPIYRAETTILPPQQSGSSISSQVLSQLGGSSGLISSTLGLSTANDVYVGMLQSRTVYDYIIDRFGLMEIYKAEHMADARTALADSVTVKSGKEEIISVSVEDKDPQRAAEMANAFIEKLKDMTQTFAVTEASKTRLFFEEQVARTKEDLIRAEEAMQGFQEETGAVKMDEQAEALIDSIADLRAQISTREVEIKVMKTYAEPRNPDLQKAEEALKGMKEELQKLEAKSGDDPDVLVPAGSIPEVGLDYTRKLRELKYQESLYELMAKQYEIARVDEAMDATIIQVLDRAVPPEKKTKPKRTIMVVLATFIGFFAAIFAAFVMEYAENVSRDEENREIVEQIRKYSLFWRKRQ